MSNAQVLLCIGGLVVSPLLLQDEAPWMADCGWLWFQMAFSCLKNRTMLPTMISILIEIYMLGDRFTPGTFLHLFCGHTRGLLESDALLQKILQTVTWQSRRRGLLLGSRWDETRWLYLLLHILDMRSHSPQPERYSGRQAMPRPKPKCLTVSWFHGWF